MNSVINANIFFFVTTVAVVIFTILGIILAVYLIKIVFNVKKSTDVLKEKVENAGEDIESVRNKIKKNSILAPLFTKKHKKKK